MRRVWLAGVALLALAGSASAQLGPIPFLATQGVDHSANAPTVGNILATCSASFQFTAQNQSAVSLQVILDDPAGATTPTILLLGAGSGAGAQGASTDPFSFKGRVRIAGATGSQFALRCW